jgi:hypothetical protein
VPCTSALQSKFFIQMRTFLTSNFLLGTEHLVEQRGFWVEIGGLDTLADKISGFPKGPQDSRELVLGAFGREYAGGATHLRLFCIDLAGHSYIESKIESGEESAGVFQTAIVIMPVEASAIDRFVTGLRKIEKARNGTAVLESRG